MSGSFQTVGTIRAVWSEPLLVAHTTLLEISCRCSYASENSADDRDLNNAFGEIARNLILSKGAYQTAYQCSQGV